MPTDTVPVTDQLGITPGTILAASWGYEQTNVDFYVVTRVTATSVWIQPIGKARLDEWHVVPVPDEPHGEPVLRRVQHYGRPDGGRHWYVHVRPYAVASPWRGEPRYETPIGWGH